MSATFRWNIAIAGVCERYLDPLESGRVEHVSGVEVLRAAAAADDKKPSIYSGGRVGSHGWRWIASDFRFCKE